MKLNIYLSLFALILLFIIFNMINYLVKENYIVECFTNDSIRFDGNPFLGQCSDHYCPDMALHI